VNTDTTDEEQPTTACSHTPDTPEAVVYVHDVGPMCRRCYTPIELRNWEPVIDSSTVTHTTGETTHHETVLVGLDHVGRAVYHDERAREILTVVPKYHRDFHADVDGDEPPLRATPPRHAPTRGKIINAPDNGVLVAIDRQNTTADNWSKEALAEFVVNEEWQALTDQTLDMIEHYVAVHDHPRPTRPSFPIAAATALLETHHGDK